jgi:hypothetical protein
MFRFTIRDVLWLTVVVALSVGWWMNSTRLSETTTRLSEAEAKQQSLQAKLDAIRERTAKAKMDEYFRNSYDGAPRRASPPR